MGQFVKLLNCDLYRALWWKVLWQPLNVGKRQLDVDDDVRELISTMKGHAYVEIFMEHVMDIHVIVEPNEVKRVEIMDEDDVAKVVSLKFTRCNRVETITFEKALIETSKRAPIETSNQRTNDPID